MQEVQRIELLINKHRSCSAFSKMHERTPCPIEVKLKECCPKINKECETNVQIALIFAIVHSCQKKYHNVDTTTNFVKTSTKTNVCNN